MTPAERQRKSEIWLTNIESKDCGIIAIQAVTGKSRLECEGLALRHGYRADTGIPAYELGSNVGVEAALEEAGYFIEPVSFLNQSAAVFALAHEYGVFTVHTAKHVMGLVEGDLHNSRCCWHAPVEDAFKITKERP